LRLFSTTSYWRSENAYNFILKCKLFYPSLSQDAVDRYHFAMSNSKNSSNQVEAVKEIAIVLYSLEEYIFQCEMGIIFSVFIVHFILP
jgi:hypothetical protein